MERNSKSSIFENWKIRCSNLYSIMTNLPTQEVISKTNNEIEVLLNEKNKGINANGNKVKWTDNKEDKLNTLLSKLSSITNDELPTGAITALNEEYLSIKYGRTKIVTSKQMDKGDMVENDSIKLLSDLDNAFYIKNNKRYSNDYLVGEPDLCFGKIRDIKSSFDINSFHNATLTPNYEWQLKGYMYLAKTNNIPELDDYTTSELCYCLVNHKEYAVKDAQRRVFFSQGLELGEEDDSVISNLKKIELNMIYDFEAYAKDYPNSDLYLETHERISIEPFKRVKRFEVKLTEEDIISINNRVLLARNYLIDKDLKSNELKRL